MDAHTKHVLKFINGDADETVPAHTPENMAAGDGDLELLDGRAHHNNGWFIVSCN